MESWRTSMSTNRPRHPTTAQHTSLVTGTLVKNMRYATTPSQNTLRPCFSTSPPTIAPGSWLHPTVGAAAAAAAAGVGAAASPGDAVVEVTRRQSPPARGDMSSSPLLPDATIAAARFPRAYATLRRFNDGGERVVMATQCATTRPRKGVWWCGGWCRTPSVEKKRPFLLMYVLCARL